MCSPTGVRILLSITSKRGWRLSKIDAKTAFLRTGDAERAVFVIPPIESEDRGSYVWLPLAAVYGLINSNAKWQVQSDQLLRKLNFIQVSVLPQLFYMMQDGEVVALLAKIVDDILISGEPSLVDSIIEKINSRFTLGTVVHGANVMRYFGLNIVQDED